MLNGVTETYSYDAGDKLLTRSGLSGSYTYGYDGNGNTTSVTGPGGTRTFTYDVEDRMISTSLGSGTTSYGYNGLRTRVSKSGFGGARTYRRDGAGVTAPVLADGASTMVPGISERSSGATRTLHHDRVGTTTRQTSVSQSVTNLRGFDAFGVALSTTNPNGSQKGFAGAFGYQEDDETGLKLLGHRFYDPATGRFLTRDPVGHGENWFAYCANSPQKSVDPSGLTYDSYVLLTLRGGRRVPPVIGGKGGNQNWRNSEFDGWSDDDLQAELDSLAGKNLSPDEKIWRKKLQTEQKARGNRHNNQKKNNYEPAPPLVPRPRMSPPMSLPLADPGPRGSREAAGGIAAGVILYWVISEGTRLFPPRNLIPIP